MTDKELVDAAWAELAQTTKGWTQVKDYQPTILSGTHWGRGRALLDQIGAVTPPLPPPTGLRFPAAAHIWGGNSSDAYPICDLVVTGDMITGDTLAAAKQTNPGLIALTDGNLDPENPDWTQRKSFQFTYGGGLIGWPGVNDTLLPSPQGVIRSWQASDRGKMLGGAPVAYDLSQPSTADLVLKALWWSWKNGVLKKNRPFDGMWSDNLFTGNTILADYACNNCGVSGAAWDTGFRHVCEGLCAFGVPVVGGNMSYRSTDPTVLAATNTSLFENLETTVAQGSGAFAYRLTEVQAWQAAGPNQLFWLMHLVQQADTVGMRFGLACACVLGGAYMPYNGDHASLYFPVEMTKGGQRHYLGQPTGAAKRSGNTWSRAFEHGTVSANFDTKQGAFS
jgi:Hypothetical glycosyl hydrolase family 15